MDMGEPLHSRHRALPRVGEVPFVSLVHLYRASPRAKRLANGKRRFKELASRHLNEELYYFTVLQYLHTQMHIALHAD